MRGIIAYHFLRARWAFAHLRGDGLRTYQTMRARKIVARAVAHSPFYRTHFAGHDLSDFGNLPTVDKAAMMAHFAQFNTRGISKDEAFAVALRAETCRDFAPVVDGDVTVGLSSGTSGHRGAFLLSRVETAAWAGAVLARVLPGVPRPGFRVAFFLRSNSNLYERVGGYVRFRYFDLMTPLADAVAALNEYAPDMIVAPPSLLAALAASANRGTLSARPTRIVSIAETLDDRDRAAIEGAFGVAVGQVYQCTEGFLAATCSRNRLHVNEDLVALQYESAGENRFTPVVTDLWRRVQPIIRYRLGDLLTLSDTPCPCGSAFQVVESVIGRCDDVCYFPSRAGVLRRVYPDTVRRMVLLSGDTITDYAAVQDAPGVLRVHLAALPGTDFARLERDVREQIATVLASYDCCADRVEVVDGLPDAVPGAKRRRVINWCPVPPMETIK